MSIIHNYKLRNIVSLLFLFTISINFFSQNAYSWIIANNKYDFGDIGEDDGEKTTSFSIKNNGTEPGIILSVTSTCGCTVANFTKEPIVPQKFGKVSVSFNPANRPGYFIKSLIVTFSNGERKKLYIKGNVTKGAERKVAGFPYVIGDIQLKSKKISFKNINARKQVQNIVMVNSGLKQTDFTLSSSSNEIKARLIPHTLSSNEKGEIEITYTPSSIGRSSKEEYIYFNFKGENIPLNQRRITIVFK